MNYSIQEITAINTYAIRQPVLRADKPIESCRFEGDELPSTHHFGCFVEDQLIGVISLYEIGNPHFDKQKSFQIRGMAVLNGYQKQGVGEALVRAAESFCANQKTSIIWFNARTSAVGFYKKMGYEVTGSEFEIKEVGPHFLMYKKI
jgi:ribosomal protein S18 acetylase RimI-like enzyme